MTIVNLIKAELVMLYGEIKHYYLNYIFFNISLLFIFTGLFFSFNDRGDIQSLVLLFGLITWQMCNSAISYLSYVIQDESMLGTLEQIFMTRTTIFQVFASKVLVNCLFNFIKALILFTICMLIFGVGTITLSLGIKNIAIITIILITVLSFYMLGLMLGGLSLYFKRVQAICNTLTYLFLFFTGITIPIENLPRIIQPISYALPITWASKCIQEIATKGLSTFYISRNLIGFLISVSIYCIIGYLSFNQSVKRAKDLGKLGQY